MLTLFLGILLDLVTGSTQRVLNAAEALEKPPVSALARRYRIGAVAFFFFTSLLLCTAAIAFTIDAQSLVHEFLGWTGIGCLHVSAYCAIRYESLND